MNVPAETFKLSSCHTTYQFRFSRNWPAAYLKQRRVVVNRQTRRFESYAVEGFVQELERIHMPRPKYRPTGEELNECSRCI
jgi:hypothetical protein